MHQIGKLFKRGSRGATWAVAGELVGRVVSIFLPDPTPISVEIISHGTALVFGIVGSLLPVSDRPPESSPDNPVDKIRLQLAAADKLFLDNLITQEEHMAMRKACLEGGTKQLKGG